MIYEYVCDEGHVTTKRGGPDDRSAPCACGLKGERRPFYLTAIVGETVMKEQKYRVSEFQEASAEVDYAYSQAEKDGVPVKRPDYYKIAKQRAAARGAKLRRA